MTQFSFDFTQPSSQQDKEIQKWVEKHNQEVIKATQMPTYPVGSLLCAIDTTQAKTNAVYLIRSVLGQVLRKSSAPGAYVFRQHFVHTLHSEIKMKTSSHDPVLNLRDVLMKTHATR